MRWHDSSSLLLIGAIFLLPLPPVPTFGFLAAEAPAGTCASNAQCGKDEFCAKLFGRCTESGKCEAKPEDCSERGKILVKPVCGCDDRTYDNACLAAAAGASVQRAGKCTP